MQPSTKLRMPTGQYKRPGLPRIDTDHPLAKGLIAYAYDWGGGVVDLINGGQGKITTSTNNITVGSGRYGQGVKYPGTAGASALITLPANAHVANFSTAAPFSFATAVFNTATPGGIIAVGTGDPSDTSGVNYGVGGTNAWTVYAVNGTLATTATGTNPLNSFNSILTSVASSASWSIYANGKLDQTGTTNATQTLTAQQITFNGVQPNTITGETGGANGFVHYFAIWNRALTATEAAQLHNDPYGFLIYPEDEIFSTVVGASAVIAPIGNPHFMGRLSNPPIRSLPALRQNLPTDSSFLTTQPETNVHFIGKFIQQPIEVLPTLRQNMPEDLPGSGQEAAVSFVGRMATQPYELLPLLRQVYPQDSSFLLPQVEATPHWIGRTRWPLIELLPLLRQNEDPPITALPTPETNQHFVGKLTLQAFELLPTLRQNVPEDSSFLTIQPETNINFIGRFTTASYELFLPLRQAMPQDVTFIQPETNTHFIGRLTAQMIELLPTLRQNIPTDASFLPIQPETNVHFVGRYSQALYRYATWMRQNEPAATFIAPQPETNTHFVGRFSATMPTVTAGLRQNLPTDVSSPIVQPDTAVSFIGRFAQMAPKLLPVIRQNEAPPPVTIQPETNTGFVGRFAAPAPDVLSSLRQSVPSDAPLSVLPDAPANFIGRLAVSLPKLLARLRQNEPTDTTLLLPQPATNVHFLGRFVQQITRVLQLFRQAPASDLTFPIGFNPNYVASTRARKMVASERAGRALIGVGKARRMVVVGIGNGVAQTNDLTPPIDAVVEVETVTFDFGPIISAGVTISAPAVTCVVYNSSLDGVIDPSPASRLIGPAQVTKSPNTGLAGQAIAQLVGTMIGGLTYRLQCVVTTSDGQTLSLWNHLACDTPN
jgi:hypothetical protein